MKLSDIPPSLFTIIAEALGVFVAEKLRLNQQNSVGNFFELFGQVILTYNSQQQLIQQGPGAPPGKQFNKEFAKATANEPLENFAPLLSLSALNQPEVQQELGSNQASTSSMNSNQSFRQTQSVSSMTVMPQPQQGEIENLQMQISSLTEEILQLKEILYCMQNNIK